MQIHLLRGESRNVIPTVATYNRIDVVVMGTAPRKGVPGLLSGKIVEKVLRNVDCSVLTVKPDGLPIQTSLIDGKEATYACKTEQR